MPKSDIDTTPKESKISTWTSYAAVALDAGLVVTVDYDCDSELNQQIRDTYPDVIAGDWGIFNVNRITIYVQRQSNGEIRKFENFIPAGNNVNQEFIITDWSAGTIVVSTPSTSASFFDPSTNSFSTTAGVGNFAADDYRVAHTYVWNGDTVSDISHSVAEGCIAESQINGEQVFGITTYDTIAQIKAETNLYDGLKLYCKNTKGYYIYDENSIETADDVGVLLPSSGIGRWLNILLGSSTIAIKTVPPTVNDDDTQGYSVGYTWLDTVAEKEHRLFDSTTGAAVWKIVPQTATDIGLGNVNNTSDANKPISNATQAALDLKINTSLIGAVDGVCPLDAGGKVDAVYLPSYVDDVLEYANLAALPVTGETGKIYITLDTSKAYRWTGSVYVEITSDPLPAQTGHNGKFLTTNGTVASWSVVNAANITVDTTNFNANLSGADTTVQAALETLDELVAGAGGHTIQDEGTPLAARTNLNFIGSAVTATDDAGNDRTTVTVNLPTTGSGLNLGTWDSSGTFTSGVRFDGSGDKVILPSADTATRTGMTPLQGELVYDTDLDKFFYGDGVTIGGVEVGSGTSGGASLSDIWLYGGF